MDAAGAAYIAGSAGTLWPTTTGAFQTNIPGAAPYAAPFIAKISADGSTLAYSTFLGDGGYPTALTVKAVSGEAFVTGQYNGNSSGNNFPTTPNAYQSDIGNGCCASFLTEFSPDGSALLYSSYFLPGQGAASSLTTTTGIALDGSGNIWLSGVTQSSQLPLKYPIQPLPANSTGFPTATAFLSRFDPAGANLTFSSYMGGLVQGGTIAGVAIDPNNRAHVAGTTADGLYTTPGAYLSSVTPAPQFVQYTYGYAAVVDADAAAPSLCYAPVLSFGNVPVGTSRTLALTVTNCGNASLTISSSQSSNPLFAISGASNTCLQSVAVGASCAIPVVFTPPAAGPASGTLSLVSDAQVPQASVALSGFGAIPVIRLQRTSVIFDPQFVGQTSPPQLVLISNAGAVPLAIDLAHTTIGGDFAFTQSGCDQPILPGRNCIFLATFTPQTVGILGGTLQIASNDPVNPSVSVGFSGTGYGSYTVPTILSLSPPAILAGGTQQVTVQVNGTNFFPASVVRIGGNPQPTAYLNFTNLTVTLDPSLLAAPGELQVTVLNPSPGGGETAPVTITIYQSIPLSARAMVFDPFSRLLFASIGAAAANNPNTIAVIDPAAAIIKQYISVGNDPRNLAVSDDGQYLYVGVDGDHSIQRIDLNTLSVEKTFALPGTFQFGLLIAHDLEVVPGASKSVVTALFAQGVSPAEAGVALFNDQGLVNYLAYDFADHYVQADSIAFAGNPPVAYGLPASSGDPWVFGLFTIDGSGIHAQPTGAPNGAVQPKGNFLVSDGKLLYTNAGQVWDPSSQAFAGTYNPSLFYASSVVPDDSLGRTFFLNQFPTAGGVSIDAYDQTSLNITGTVPFPSPLVYGLDAVALNRWGSDGFAFLVGNFVPTTGSDQLILFRSSIAHSAQGTNPVPILSTLGTPSVTAGGPPFRLSVQGASFVPGCVVKLNGSERSTTFVSATQLTAAIPASDIAQAGSAQIAVVNPAPGGGSSGSLTLTVMPPPPQVSLQPAMLTFASQTVSSQSASQSLTLQNTGGMALAVGGIQASGDFTETNNCPASLAALASCSIAVTFAPTATGTRQGALTISDNAAGSPQTIALSGAGTARDFAFGTGSSTSNTATVSAGQPASYSLSIVAGAGTIGTVMLSCTQVPVNASCTLSPSSLTLSSGSTANFTVTVNTQITQSASLLLRFSLSIATCGFVWLLALPLSHGGKKLRFLPRNRINLIFLLLVFTSIAAGLSGCNTGAGPSTTAAAVTPKGTYTLQVVATEGTTSHSQPITLVVQ